MRRLALAAALLLSPSLLALTPRAGWAAPTVVSRCCRSRSSGGHASYGGGHHSGSHGGHYTGGSGGSSHKGGHYTNPRGGHTYGSHKH